MKTCRISELTLESEKKISVGDHVNNYTVVEIKNINNNVYTLKVIEHEDKILK